MIINIDIFHIETEGVNSMKTGNCCVHIYGHDLLTRKHFQCTTGSGLKSSTTQ